MKMACFYQPTMKGIVMSHQASKWMFAALLSCTLASCVEQVPGLTVTQSLRVALVAPADPGSVNNRLPDPAPGQKNSVTVNVSAIGPDGQVDTTFSRQVSVYAQYLGTLSPELGKTPIKVISSTNGVSGNVTLELPPLFSATTLWIEDGQGDDATYATGTSPTLWYRDPYIVDIQKPVDETGLAAFTVSPLQDKQVRVSGSRYPGRLMVTSVFAQGYTVSDVKPPVAPATRWTTDGYDHALIFAFSRPKDTKRRDVVVGEFIDAFTGGISEFNGLTELTFPQTIVNSDERPTGDPNLVPLPEVVITSGPESWFTKPIAFEKNEAAAIQLDNPKLCPLDTAYDRFKQWRLAADVDGVYDCAPRSATAINVVSAGLAFDPKPNVGKIFKKVVGVLKPVSFANGGNIWIINPRDEMDIVQ
jgi:hypothetical protein